MQGNEDGDFAIFSIFWYQRLRLFSGSDIVLMSDDWFGIFPFGLWAGSSHVGVLFFQHFLNEFFLVKDSDKFPSLVFSSIEQEVFGSFVGEYEL